MKNIQLILVLMVLFGLAGCNTARGFGADLELLGKSMKTMGNKKEQVVVEGAQVYQQGQVIERTEVDQNGVQVQTYPVTDEQVFQETYTEVPASTSYPVEDPGR